MLHSWRREVVLNLFTRKPHLHLRRRTDLHVILVLATCEDRRGSRGLSQISHLHHTTTQLHRPQQPYLQVNPVLLHYYCQHQRQSDDALKSGADREEERCHLGVEDSVALPPTKAHTGDTVSRNGLACESSSRLLPQKPPITSKQRAQMLEYKNLQSCRQVPSLVNNPQSNPVEEPHAFKPNQVFAWKQRSLSN